MIFKRKHKHEWRTHFLYSGAANVSKYRECSCGERVYLGLTPAGWQQVGWWHEIFPEWDTLAIQNGVEHGMLPYPYVWIGVQANGSLGRLLTQDEALELIDQQAELVA